MLKLPKVFKFAKLPLLCLCFQGEIAVNFLDTKSYTSLHAAVNGMFPPTDSSEQV